ncbi:hypothetical protein BT93_K1653 [Corymbia citriodora subsp. variegata]|nr:hypothetical protein BT93_K1653 [Corymbia citriodora subsp. variegata]
MASRGILLVAPAAWTRPDVRERSPLKTCEITCAIAPGRFYEMAVEHGAKYSPGGDIQNFHFFLGVTPNSIGLAQLKLQLLGATGFIGCIGKDKSGEQMKMNAKLAAVTVPYYEDENAPTDDTRAVSVLGGERSLAADLSAAISHKSEYLKQPEISALVEREKYICHAGLFPPVFSDSIQLVDERAAANKEMFMKNLSAPFTCEFFKDAEEEVFLYMDFVLGNETQAQTLSAVHGREGLDPVVAEDGKVKKLPVIKLPPEKLVDTKGAGDAFVGGFVSQLVQ